MNAPSTRATRLAELLLGVARLDGTPGAVAAFLREADWQARPEVLADVTEVLVRQCLAQHDAAVAIRGSVRELVDIVAEVTDRAAGGSDA